MRSWSWTFGTAATSNKHDRKEAKAPSSEKASIKEDKDRRCHNKKKKRSRVGARLASPRHNEATVLCN